MAYVEAFCRVTLLVVLATAAVGKLRGRRALRELASSLVALRVVRPGNGGRVAVLLVAAELGTAAALALAWWPVPGFAAATWLPAVPGFAAAAALMAVLTVGMARAVRAGVRAPCRCFGGSAVPVSRVHVARNAGLCALALVGGVAALAGGAGEPAGLVVACAAGIVAAVPLILLDEVVELFRPVPAGAGEGGL